jgi:hypothetical protein
MEQDIRSSLLASDEGESVIVEHRGVQVEVRAPTLAQQRDFTRRAKDPKTKETDGVKMLVLAVIGCTYHPGSDKRVFEAADEEALLNKSTGDTIVGKVSRVLQRIMSEKPEDIEAGFDEAREGN